MTGPIVVDPISIQEQVEGWKADLESGNTDRLLDAFHELLDFAEGIAGKAEKAQTRLERPYPLRIRGKWHGERYEIGCMAEDDDAWYTTSGTRFPKAMFNVEPRPR